MSDIATWTVPVDGVTYYYTLEAVDLAGQGTFYGPVWARAGLWHRAYLPVVRK